MFATCDANCLGSLTLVAPPICPTYERSEIPVRLLLATCDTDFPGGSYTDSVLGNAFAALVTAGKISATPELAEMVWADPATTKKRYRSHRYPSKSITTGRTLTAKDYNAFDVDHAGTATPYNDRLMYVNDIQNQATKVRGYITDKGNVYLFLNELGEFCAYDINFFTGWDTEVDGTCVEFKNYAIEFVGDPQKTLRTPYLSIPDAGVQSSIGWMYEAS